MPSKLRPSKSAGEEVSDAGERPPVMPDLAERVLRHLSFGVVVFDGDLKVVFRNEAAALLLPEEDCIAETLAARAVESEYEDWRAELKAVIDTRLEKLFEDINLRTEGGENRLLNLFCTPLSREDSSETIGGVLVLEDVTWREGVEKRLAISERLAAVGKLSARVAHELSNPLDGILRYINLAARVTEAGDAAKTKQYLAEARKGLMRMVQILRELLEFSRSTVSAQPEGNINQTVEEAIRALGERPQALGVAVVCDFEEPMPVIPGSNLFQIFCNLTKNALDAMEGGGTLSCKTRRQEGNVVIEFADTGAGLPAEGPETVFEPFFTTKEPGKGTGLGLSICQDIIEKYNGTLTAENRAEGGALFTVRIPMEAGVTMRSLRRPSEKT